MTKQVRRLWFLPALFLLPVCLSAQAVKQADERVAAERSEVARLIKTLNDPQLRAGEPQRIVEAVKRSGELKATEAIGGLISLLSFARVFPWEKEQEEKGFVYHSSTMSLGRRYPAVSALFQIGEPALPALIDYIATDESDTTARENAAAAVMLIHREEPQKGICYLKAAAAKSTSPVAVARLNQAAEFGRKWLSPDTALPNCQY